MRLTRLPRLAAVVLGCASAPLLAQHEGHTMPATGSGGWSLAFHSAAFGQYVDQKTQRGDRQLGLIDWEMLTARRPVAGGTLRLRAMTSVGSSLGGSEGYPLLLQTGGSYRHGYIHDRQHPHDALMEISAAYERPLVGGVAMSVYAVPIGEPALGPPTYLHRASARNDPAAPLSHHWQDATHVSYGVATVGFTMRSLRVEGSAFNARESDYKEPWPDFTGAKLGSYAGRLSWTVPRVAVSTWWGYISTHDPLASVTPMHRYGASVMTQLPSIGGGQWSSTAVWGMNLHHHGGSSHALLHGDPNASPHHHSSSLLVESNLDLGDNNAIFTRAERIMKNGEELGFLGGDLTALYDVKSIAAGYRRTVVTTGKVEIGVGARGAVNFVPQSLVLTYGTRQPKGFTIFAQLRSG